jgi:hypothetical protein
VTDSKQSPPLWALEKSAHFRDLFPDSRTLCGGIPYETHFSFGGGKGADWSSESILLNAIGRTSRFYVMRRIADASLPA